MSHDLAGYAKLKEMRLDTFLKNAGEIGCFQLMENNQFFTTGGKAFFLLRA